MPKVVLRQIDSLTSADFLEGGDSARALWKLYPWEWIVREAIGEPLVSDPSMTAPASVLPRFLGGAQRSHHEPATRLQQLYEPPWKLVMSSRLSEIPGLPALLTSTTPMVRSLWLPV